MEKFNKFVISLALLLAVVSGQDTEIEEASSGLFQIEGKIFPPEIGDNNLWTQDTQVIFQLIKFQLDVFKISFLFRLLLQAD